MKEMKEMKEVKRQQFVMVIVIAIAVIFSYGFSWRYVGRDPLIPGGVRSVSDLHAKFVSYGYLIKSRLEVAEPGVGDDLYTAILESAEGAREITLPSGSYFVWMIYGSGVKRDVVWKGGSYLVGFSFVVNCRGREWRLFVAQECGNLCLRDSYYYQHTTQQLPQKAPPQVWWNPCCRGGGGGGWFFFGYHHSSYYSPPPPPPCCSPPTVYTVPPAYTPPTARTLPAPAVQTK